MSALASKLSKIGGHGCGCPKDEHVDGCCFSGGGYPRKPSYSSSNEDHAYLGTPPPFRTNREANVEEERVPLMERVLDVTRNFGPARGIIDFTKQNLAHTYTPVPKPDKKALPGWTDEDCKEHVQNLLCWHRMHLDGATWLDSSERLNFTKKIQLFVEQLMTYGEVFAMVKPKLRQSDVNRRPFTTSVMLINPMRVATPFDKRIEFGKKQKVFEGLEKDDDGRTIAAFVHDNPTVSEDCIFPDKPKRVPVWGVGKHSHRRMFCHFYEVIEEDQCRGVTPYAASVEIFELWRQLQRDIALRAQRQNKTTGIIKSKCADDDDDLPNIGTGGHTDEGLEWYTDPELMKFKGIEDETGKQFGAAYRQLMQRSAYHKNNRTSQHLAEAGVHDIYLGLDEDYVQTQLDNGTLAASDLFGSFADAVAAAHGYSTNQVLRNYTDGNYTGQRSGRIDTTRTLERLKCQTDAFATWLWKLIGEESVANGLFDLPAGVIEREGLRTNAQKHRYAVKHIDALFAHDWAMPAPKIIELEKDMRGFEKALELGIGVDSEIVAEVTGRDLESNLAIQCADKKKRIDADLDCEVYEEERRQQLISEGKLPSREQKEPEEE